jgi:hypothetical protein
VGESSHGIGGGNGSKDEGKKIKTKLAALIDAAIWKKPRPITQVMMLSCDAFEFVSIDRSVCGNFSLTIRASPCLIIVLGFGLSSLHRLAMS